MSDLWVFAYGSLLWDPGFAPAEEVRATLPDHRWSFCMWSIHHRGTEENPGLVLALDTEPGATCEGMALRAAPQDREAVLAMLRERELISSAYEEHWLPLTLADGRAVTAVAYVIARGHIQYCAGLSLEAQAQIIAHAEGGRGHNRDYLTRTVDRLHALAVPDPELDALALMVQGHTGDS